MRRCRCPPPSGRATTRSLVHFHAPRPASEHFSNQRRSRHQDACCGKEEGEKDPEAACEVQGDEEGEHDHDGARRAEGRRKRLCPVEATRSKSLRALAPGDDVTLHAAPLASWRLKG